MPPLKHVDYRLKLMELALERQRWNLRELADALDAPYQNILYWNQGRAMPNMRTLLRILKLLQCRFEELVELYPHFKVETQRIEQAYSPLKNPKKPKGL
jgi:transcriptional regulator with XRE-family HTH domain